MWTSALFCAKIIGFLEIFGVSARTRGLNQCGHFSDKVGGELIFRDFVRKSFMDGPLFKRVIFHNMCIEFESL